MKVLLSWVRDFVDVPETPETVGRQLSLRGLALEGLEPAPAGVLPPGRTDAGLTDAVLDFDVTANRPDCLYFTVESVVMPDDGSRLRVFITGSEWDAQRQLDDLVPGTADVMVSRRDRLTASVYAGQDRRGQSA